MRCVPRSPPRLCLSPVISVLGRLPQIARQGGHREGQNVSLERGRDCIGHLVPVVSSAQEAELFPDREFGEGWG